MKFGQLIEYNMKKNFFFLKNHAQNMVDKIFPDPFKVDYISGLTVYFYCIQFVFIVYRNASIKRPPFLGDFSINAPSFKRPLE